MKSKRPDRNHRLAQRYAELLARASGIATPEHQLEPFLKKVRTFVPEEISLPLYLERLEEDPALLERFVEGMCTHETRFFRHPEQFELLERVWLPGRKAAVAKRKVRAWSVACSSGEEPFSVAMWLADHFPRTEGWSIEVVATDLSNGVLERAARATWPLARRGEISPERLERYMLRGHGKHEGLMRAQPELRALVQFKQLNLVRPPYAVGADFDLVFLRNVLIYFSPETRRSVLNGVLSAMAANAVLVTGPSEGVSYLQEARLRSVAPHLYAYAR